MSLIEDLIKQLDALPYPESERMEVILDALVGERFLTREGAALVLDLHVRAAPTTWLWLLVVLTHGFLSEVATCDPERIAELTGTVSPQRLEAISQALTRIQLP